MIFTKTGFMSETLALAGGLAYYFDQEKDTEAYTGVSFVFLIMMVVAILAAK